MNSARDVYKEILKSLKYRKKIYEINEIQDKKRKKEQNDKLDKEVEVDVNNNEYRKIDAYIKSTYIALGVEPKTVKDIKDSNVYDKLKSDMIELCEKVSYDKFYAWMVEDWKDYYNIKGTSEDELTKKVKYYIGLKAIVLSIIKSTADDSNIRKAQLRYNNSLDMYQMMLKEIENIGRDSKKSRKQVYKVDSNYDINKIAGEKLIYYKNLCDNIDDFNNNNYYYKSVDEIKNEIKSIDRFFMINKNNIKDDLYNNYLNLKEQYKSIFDIEKETKINERYKLYEMIITSDNPNLDQFDYMEIDLLERCRREYVIDKNSDIRESIIRNEKIIKEERNRQFEEDSKSDW